MYFIKRNDTEEYLMNTLIGGHIWGDKPGQFGFSDYKDAENCLYMLGWESLCSVEEFTAKIEEDPETKFVLKDSNDKLWPYVKILKDTLELDWSGERKEATRFTRAQAEVIKHCFKLDSCKIVRLYKKPGKTSCDKS